MAKAIVYLLSFLAAPATAQDAQAGKGVNFYSIEKEIALGRQVAEDFRSKTQALESPNALAYVTAIGRRLVKETGGPAFPYSFALIDGDPTAIHEPAAFPGGLLFVPSSLILAAADEDELAGMMAHAIAHVASRDQTRQATKAELVNIASVPLIYMGGWTGYAIGQGQSPAIPLGMLQAWRRFELSADRLAARSMAAAGWDPAALARYIERIQPPDSAQPKPWSALPERSQRLEAIRTEIEGLPARVYLAHDGLGAIQEDVRRAARPH